MQSGNSCSRPEPSLQLRIHSKSMIQRTYLGGMVNTSRKCSGMDIKDPELLVFRSGRAKYVISHVLAKIQILSYMSFMPATYSCNDADGCISDIFIYEYSAEMAGRGKKGIFDFHIINSFQAGPG